MRGRLKYLLLFTILLVFILGIGFSQSLKKSTQIKSMKSSLVIPSKMSHRKRKGPQELKKKYEIKLRSRRFTPLEDISSAIQSHIRPASGNRVHVLMQFMDIPDASQHQILKSNGVKLLRYIPNKAWLVSVPRGITEAELLAARARWLGEIKPSDKIFPGIRKRGVGPWAHNADGSVNLEVSFFKDVPLTEARSLINTMGAAVKEESGVSHRLTVIVSPDEVMNIAGNDIVRWVIEERPPKKRLNDGSRANVNADAIQTTPYNLNGSSINVGIWDGGDVDVAHSDFGSRVTVVDNAGADDHATHVAGTMGGDGTLSASNGGTAYQWKGIAPAADIISYFWDNSITDHDQAINTYGIKLSQNSWGFDLVGPPAEPEYYGYYGWGAPEYDDIVTGLYGEKIPVIFSAGNDRNDIAGDYDCIGPPSTAKNVICVGAIHSDDNSMTIFSSWGPTDDGRIKPDIVAPGDEVGGDGGIKSPLPGDTYGVYVGTSMAAPCVSGCVALIIEDFHNLYDDADPLPSTVKGLLIHEARDLGNTGPDFSFGYGAIDVKNSIDKLRGLSLKENMVSDGETDEYTLYVPSLADEVKITLVWDDPPATEEALKTLINDLDLIVTDPDGVRHYPWTLDPDNPSNPAVRTREDTTNNVEQVVVTTGIVGGNWTVNVHGTEVPAGPQDYSLIFTPELGFAIGRIYEDSEYSQEELFFDRTDVVYIEFYATLGGDPVTGATVTADLSLSDGTPVTTVGLIEQGEAGYYRYAWNSTGATPDVYTVEITFEEIAIIKHFHLYPESGVSAYRFDYNEDESDDYVLENKHLIAVYNGRSDWDKTLLYLRQKDTDTSFTFADISDGNTIGRGEATTGNMNDISFGSFSFTQLGENLANTDLNITENLSEMVNPSTLNILIINDHGSIDISADRFDFVLDNLGHITTLETSASTNSSTWTNYDVLVWASSDDISPINSGNTTTRDALVNYVNNGGRLVIEGGEIGYIATNNNWNSFLSNVLHIPDLFYGDGKGLGDVELEVFTGSHPLRTIPNNLPASLYIDPGTGNNDYGPADGVEALPDAEMIYRWNGYTGTQSGNAVGGLVAYDDNPNVEGGQIVYLSFDLLHLDNSNDEAHLIENAVEWVRPREIVSTTFDLFITMKNEQADYLVYLLSNFDDKIDDVLDIFAPIAGFLGSSVDDDIYHIGNGSDDLVTSLSSGAWTNFSSLSDEEKYVAIYDDPSGGDDMNNLISWVSFPNAATVSFQDVGCWYETGTGALRINYNTTSATVANEAEYILAFTLGDYTVIEQWMSNIAAGDYPAPNFMTAPSSLSVSVNPQAWPIGIIPASQITQSTELDRITVTNDGSFSETFTLNISSSVPTWFPGLAIAENTYVLWGLFCGAADYPVTSLFQSEDIIILGPPELATTTKFGDISLSDNGVDVIPSASVKLWFQFQAPTATTDNREHAITITIGVEQTP